MSQQNEVRRVVPVNELGNDDPNMMIPAAPIQRVQSSHATAIAVQKPRVLALVEEKALEEATLLGADAFYQWGKGEDQITGPSKELANVLARCWGNCALEMQPVQETRDAWIFTVSFIDLETGYTLPRQFRQAKGWTVYGKLDAARKEDIRFQIGQSKAIRNVIINAIPGWLVRRAMDRAMGGVREAVEKQVKEHGLKAIQDKAMAVLDSKGAPEERVLASLDRKNRAQLTVEDLVILKGNIAALDSGAESVDTLYPKPEPKQAADTLGKLKTEQADPLDPKQPVAPKTEDPKTETPKPEPKTGPDQSGASFLESLGGEPEKKPKKSGKS